MFEFLAMLVIFMIFPEIFSLIKGVTILAAIICAAAIAMLLFAHNPIECIMIIGVAEVIYFAYQIASFQMAKRRQTSKTDQSQKPPGSWGH